MEIAKVIMMVIKSNLMIVWSWGADFFSASEKGVSFHVNGFKFEGYVRIVYDAGADLFNVQYITDNLRMVKEQKGIYIDSLISTIDYEVEKVDNYKERVEKEYSLR